MTEDLKKKHYSFILFIVKDGEHSLEARSNLEQLCEEWLEGSYSIEVVDVMKDFQTALDHDILLTPSVIKTEPGSRVIIHGDLSDPDKFVEALNLKKMSDHG